MGFANRILFVIEPPDIPSGTSLLVPSQHTIVPMSFTPEEDIDLAFSKLSASVTSTIESVNFPRLQRAAIERANSPKLIHKSNELVPIIDGANSFQALCTMLAKSPYWNFLDIRILEAMAAVSLIPATQESVENFKKTFFGMTLAEAAPRFPILPLKSDHTAVTEELDRDPNKMTIFELHKHRFYLETELLQTGPDTCTICRIVIGSVMIIWQIHVDHVYNLKAYSLLKKNQSQLQLQNITALSIPAANTWEDVPILWRGQDVELNGPINPLPEKVQQKPYLLPEGYQWAKPDIEVIADAYKTMHYALKEFLQWITFHPLTPKSSSWSFVVERNNQPVGAMLGYPLHIQLGTSLLTYFRFFHLSWSVLNESVNIMFKESIRRVKLSGYNQGVTYLESDSIFKPLVTLTKYKFTFSSISSATLPSSPTTPGWRSMTSNDIASALALTNKCSSQFEIGQVFKSEEEFTYYFMCPVIENYMQPYVVEDPVTGDITDVAGFKLEQGMDGRNMFAYITILVAMKSPPRQLLTDLLVCAKQAKADILYTFKFGLGKEIFEDLLIIDPINCHWYFVNYQYKEIDESKFCLFCY